MIVRSWSIVCQCRPMRDPSTTSSRRTKESAKSEMCASLKTRGLENLKGKENRKHKLLFYSNLSVKHACDTSAIPSTYLLTYVRIAYVEFYTPESVLLAMSLSGT